MSTTFMRVGARLLVIPLTTSVFLAAPAPASQAEPRAAATVATGAASQVRTETSTPTRAELRAKRIAQRKRFGNRAVAVARSRAGSSYAYGGNGPRAFDCSGLTRWVFKRLGKRLPRTSDAQAGATRRVKHPRRGDLVFFHNGGDVYHVGVYAGRRQLWHASRPGTPVRKERIWTGSVFYGRVR
jgi:cell wall-associated NlpC family hydrolase